MIESPLTYLIFGLSLSVFPVSRKGNKVKQIRLRGYLDNKGLICHEKENNKGIVHTTIIEIEIIEIVLIKTNHGHIGGRVYMKGIPLGTLEDMLTHRPKLMVLNR